jgi:hypothetical protein
VFALLEHDVSLAIQDLLLASELVVQLRVLLEELAQFLRLSGFQQLKMVSSQLLERHQFHRLVLIFGWSRVFSEQMEGA